MFRKKPTTHDNIKVAPFCGKCGKKITLGNLYCTGCGAKAEIEENGTEIITSNDSSPISDLPAAKKTEPTESLNRIDPIQRPKGISQSISKKPGDQFGNQQAGVGGRPDKKQDKKAIEQQPPEQLSKHHAPKESARDVAPQRTISESIGSEGSRLGTANPKSTKQPQKRSKCGYIGCEESDIYMNSGYCMYHYKHEKYRSD